MVWLGVYGEDLTAPVIFEDGIMNMQKGYIKEVLPLARKCGNDVLGNH